MRYMMTICKMYKITACVNKFCPGFSKRSSKGEKMTKKKNKKEKEKKKKKRRR